MDDHAIEVYVSRFSEILNRKAKCELMQHQFDAILSFFVSIGLDRFKDTAVRKQLQKCPNDPFIPKLFLRFSYIQGKPSKKLIRRRLTEGELFRTGTLKFDWAGDEIKDAIKDV